MDKNSLKIKPKVVFTGGGSGGHVFPNKSLIDFYSQNFEIVYIGTSTGVEMGIVNSWGIRFIPIQAGKFRRYIDFKNILDIFKVGIGFVQCIKILIKEKPEFIFSKGGFVSVPVCVAGALLKIPVYVHEADSTPGLANRITSRFATKVFLTFPPKQEPKFSYVVSGLPMRNEIYFSDSIRGKDFLGIKDNKPVLLILGGSLGSTNINKAVWEALPVLLENFIVVHSTGKGKLNESVSSQNYIQKEFIGSEIFDCISAADIIVSRAGAGAVMELLTLQKPTLFIPLGLDQSRGDQIENCDYIKTNKVGSVLMEEDLNTESFVKSVQDLYSSKNQIVKNIKSLNLKNATEVIIKEIGK